VSAEADLTFGLTQEQEETRAAVLRLCERPGGESWLNKDEKGGSRPKSHSPTAKAG
jgi:hypothetical protein